MASACPRSWFEGAYSIVLVLSHWECGHSRRRPAEGGSRRRSKSGLACDRGAAQARRRADERFGGRPSLGKLGTGEGDGCRCDQIIFADTLCLPGLTISRNVIEIFRPDVRHRRAGRAHPQAVEIRPARYASQTHSPGATSLRRIDGGHDDRHHLVIGVPGAIAGVWMASRRVRYGPEADMSNANSISTPV